MTGFYTSLGNSLELVSQIDDASAIIGPGEEVRLEFAAEIEPVAPSYTRRYILELNGWAKDKDLYTRDGDTVGPLPMRDETSDPAARDKLHNEFNLRFRTGT